MGDPIDTFSTSVLVGIQKILQLIKSEDLEVQIQAVKVVANLAAEGAVSSLSTNICKYTQIFTTDELSVVEIPISDTLALCLQTGSKFMQLLLFESHLLFPEIMVE